MRRGTLVVIVDKESGLFLFEDIISFEVFGPISSGFTIGDIVIFLFESSMAEQAVCRPTIWGGKVEAVAKLMHFFAVQSNVRRYFILPTS